jgi:hypothetical protein
MERLDTSLLSNILSRCKRPNPALARGLNVDDGNFVPFSSYRLVSKEWAAKSLQHLGTVKVLHKFEELDPSSLQRLLECAPHIKILDIAFPITTEPSKSNDNKVGSSKSGLDPPWEVVESPARDALLKLLTNHEWVEVRARHRACPFVQDLWANSKLQTLDMDVIDFPDRSQQQNKDVNLLIAALLHNTTLTSLTTSWDTFVSNRNFGNAVAAIGARGFTSSNHLCLLDTAIRGPYTEMLSILRALFPNLESISLPNWWPGVAGLSGRGFMAWPTLKTLAVGTVPSVAAILHEIENGQDTSIVEQGIVFPECADPEMHWGIHGYPRLPHVCRCITLIQHIGVETLVLNGVVMGTNFAWVRTALELFPSFKMLEVVLIIWGGSSREILRRGLEIRLLSENKDWTAIESVSQEATPFRELRNALDDSWAFNVVVDWPGKVREDSF